MKNSYFARWQANFWTGLAIILPAVISVAVLLWLFGTVAIITDTLLVFLPHSLTHKPDGDGRMYWYWSAAALLWAIVLIGLVGLIARNYFGKRLIEWVDSILLHVPLLNKIYGAMKQVNDAFSPGGKDTFRTVVLIPFPHPGVYSIGFLTSDQHHEAQAKSGQSLLGVFVPTTPNPTSGFLLLVPEASVIKLEMSVADGIKYLISLGSIVPGYPLAGLAPPPHHQSAAAATS